MSTPALAVEQPVQVRLVCAHGQVRRVDAAWRRLPVERLWIGQPAQAIEPVLNRTLTICLQAHIGAAQQAVRAAIQTPDADADAPQATDARIRLEAARDTLRRWLLDYPRVFGGTWDAAALRAWRGIDGVAALAAYCRTYVFGLTPEAWLTLDDRALDAWIDASATLPACWLARGLAEPLRHHLTLPAVNLLEWAHAHAAQLLRGDVPAAAPSHAQSDVTPTGRDLPSALLLHRLRRLALACIDNPTPEHGGLRCGDIGIGWARTARGLLLHLARIEQGNVTAYRILPPTFWNAAPSGIMIAALTGLATEQAARCTEQLLLLLDPCAPFELEVTLADETLQPTASTGSTTHA
jgi:hypothetical protein